jgi:hypothetical protein
MYYFKFILFSAYNGNHSWVLERGMDGLIYNVKRHSSGVTSRTD